MEGTDSRGVSLGRQVPAAPGWERRCLPGLLLEGVPQEAIGWRDRVGEGQVSRAIAIPAAHLSLEPTEPLGTLLAYRARPLLLGGRSPLWVGLPLPQL